MRKKEGETEDGESIREAKNKRKMKEKVGEIKI